MLNRQFESRDWLLLLLLHKINGLILGSNYYNCKHETSSIVFATKIQIYKQRTLYTSQYYRIVIMQSDTPQSNDELPKDFTSRIINIIQNKQQNSEEINLDSENDEESQLYAPPEKQSRRSCKKSSKKGNKDVKTKEMNKKAKKNKYLLSDKSDQESNHLDVPSQEQSSDLKNQPANNQREKAETRKQEILESHQILKQYFQGFLTKVLKRMEDSTNKVLSSLTKRTEELEEKVESLASQPQIKQAQTDPELNNAETKIKKQPYIKAWMKMNYIERIQKKQMTVKEAAKELKIKQSAVQQWLTTSKKKKSKATTYKSAKLNNLKKKMSILEQKKTRNDNPADLDSDFLQELE